MNFIEQRALAWIAETTGFKKSDIRYSNNTSPDFITPDGRGFEVKHCWGSQRSFMISPRQWQKLFKMPGCVILVFRNDNNPEAIIPLWEIPPGTIRWGEYRIDCYETNPGSVSRETYLNRIKDKAKKKVAAMLT